MFYINGDTQSFNLTKDNVYFMGIQIGECAHIAVFVVYDTFGGGIRVITDKFSEHHYCLEDFNTTDNACAFIKWISEKIYKDEKPTYNFIDFITECNIIGE